MQIVQGISYLNCCWKFSDFYVQGKEFRTV